MKYYKITTSAVATFIFICLISSCTKEIDKIEAPYLIPILITDNEAQYRFEYNAELALVKYIKTSGGVIEENTLEYDIKGRIVKRNCTLNENGAETEKTYTYSYLGNTIYESDENEKPDTLTVNNYDLMRYAKFTDEENGRVYNELMEYTANFRLTKVSVNDIYTENDVENHKTEIQTFEFDEKQAPYYRVNVPRWFVINKLPYGKYWSSLSVVRVEKKSILKQDKQEISSDTKIAELSYTYNEIDAPVTVVWSEGNNTNTIKIGYKDINGLWQQPTE